MASLQVSGNQKAYQQSFGIVAKLGNVDTLEADENPNAFKKLVGTDEVTIGFEDFVKKVDNEAISKEIKRLECFLMGIDKKLSNERFMANAKPEIIQKEQQKKEDTLSKIESLKAQLN